MGLYHDDSMQLAAEHLEIRLLILYPATFLSPLHGRLVKVSLSNFPSFNALCYVWGDPATTTTIVLNGHPLPVSHNLETALRHIRCYTEQKVLWVDALCINQADLHERSQQVQIMGKIYSSATSVFVWLDNGDLQSDKAFDCMHRIQEASDPTDVHPGTIRDNFQWFVDMEEEKWFSRLWTIQEFILSKNDPVMMCGTKLVTWSSFLKAWDVVATAVYPTGGLVRQRQSNTDRSFSDNPELNKPPDGKSQFDILDFLRKAVQQEGHTDTITLMTVLSAECKVTDPKDRLYAVLGLLKPKYRESVIKVDYGKTTARIYAEAMALIRLDHLHMTVITNMRYHGGKSAILDLPSWVPDFNSQGNKAHRTVPAGARFKSGFGVKSCGARPYQSNGYPQTDLQSFLVDAVFVDTVAETIPFDDDIFRCIDQFPAVDDLAAKATTIRTANEFLGPFYERFRQKEPLWKTLGQNRYRTGPAPDFYEDLYHLSLRNSLYDIKAEGERGKTENGDRLVEWLRHLQRYIPGGTFFTTDNGLIGVGVQDIQQGDKVSTWFDFDVPLVVRPQERNGDHFYTLIGAAYVSGIMEGQWIDEVYSRNLIASEKILIR